MERWLHGTAVEFCAEAHAPPRERRARTEDVGRILKNDSGTVPIAVLAALLAIYTLALWELRFGQNLSRCLSKDTRGILTRCRLPA